MHNKSIKNNDLDKLLQQDIKYPKKRTLGVTVPGNASEKTFGASGQVSEQHGNARMKYPY